jgi:hypothetical protein
MVSRMLYWAMQWHCYQRLQTMACLGSQHGWETLRAASEQQVGAGVLIGGIGMKSDSERGRP